MYWQREILDRRGIAGTKRPPLRWLNTIADAEDTRSLALSSPPMTWRTRPPILSPLRHVSTRKRHVESGW
jgi:hypothetical protein